MNRIARGFTIVELLIVIVVIAILASVTVVAYSGIQNRARFAAAAVDLRAIHYAMEEFRLDNNRYPVHTNRSELAQVLDKAGLYEETRSNSGSNKRFSMCIPPGHDNWAVVVADRDIFQGEVQLDVGQTTLYITKEGTVREMEAILHQVGSGVGGNLCIGAVQSFMQPNEWVHNSQYPWSVWSAHASL